MIRKRSINVFQIELENGKSKEYKVQAIFDIKIWIITIFLAFIIFSYKDISVKKKIYMS